MAVKRFKASPAEKLERRPYTLEEVALTEALSLPRHFLCSGHVLPT